MNECVEQARDTGRRNVRKLNQIEIDFARNEIWALDEGGELWFGTLETSDDARKVVNWSPVQLPPDGMAFSEPQLSFWDRMEKEARDNYEASLDRPRKTSALAQEEQTDAAGTREEAEDSSDLDLEDGEGTDPAVG